jgi:hypothetical protein
MLLELNKLQQVRSLATSIGSDSLPLALHRGVFCQFPFRWIKYCHSSKSTGKETGKTHLCALAWILAGTPDCKGCMPRIEIRDLNQNWEKGIQDTSSLLSSSLGSKPRTTDTQWRHKLKISEKLGRCGRQIMLWHLGLGLNFRPCSEGYFLSGRP